MKTDYYRFYSFAGKQASGGENRHSVLVRQYAPRHSASTGDKVISLDEYRTSPAGKRTTGPARPKRPGSGGKEKLLLALELLSCAALIAVAAAACAVFLL